jgi:hypothetical protein
MEEGRGLEHWREVSIYSKATAARQRLQKPCGLGIARTTCWSRRVPAIRV